MLEHLELYGNVDIALDTTPYNGTTTTCEALWMGVPVVTLIGNDHVSRTGYSIMQQANLPQLATSNAQSFVATAIDISRQPELIRHLRNNLRPHLQTSQLCDSASFVKELEQEFKKCWENYCSNHNNKNK
jgi:predicted O-linked N-acetylglucosamine transferase (SPINDLY family)